MGCLSRLFQVLTYFYLALFIWSSLGPVVVLQYCRTTSRAATTFQLAPNQTSDAQSTFPAAEPSALQVAVSPATESLGTTTCSNKLQCQVQGPRATLYHGLHLHLLPHAENLFEKTVFTIKIAKNSFLDHQGIHMIYAGHINCKHT